MSGFSTTPLRGRPAATAAWLFAGSLTDGIGFALLVPLLSSLVGSELNNPVARNLPAGLERLHIPATTLSLLTLFVSIIALRSLIQILRDWGTLKLRFGMIDSLREDCIRAMHAAEWRWLVGQRHTAYMALVIGEVDRIGAGLRSMARR